MPCIRLATAIALTCALPATLPAQQPLEVTRTLPVGYENSVGNDTTDVFLGLPFAGRYQAAYGPSLAGTERPIRIVGLQFRPAPGATSLTNGSYPFTLDVSTCRNPASNLDWTFANNHGADRIRVFDGVVAVAPQTLGTAPHPFVFTVPFDRPFEWDPKCGAILFEFHFPLQNLNPATTLWDGFDGSSQDASWLLHHYNPNTPQALGAGTDMMVANLILESDAIPASLQSAPGPGATAAPFGEGVSQRVQEIYGAGEVGFDGRTRIHSLSWRIDGSAAYPGGTYDLAISLSTSTVDPNGPSLTFAANHGADQKTVFDGILTAPSAPAGTAPRPWTVTCELDEPFEYDPSHGNLVVDLQVRSSSVQPAVPFAAAQHPGQAVRRVWSGAGHAATTGSSVLDQSHVLGVHGEPFATMPESADSALGSTGLEHPFASPATSRVLVQYAPTELATDRPIYVQHLSFRPDSITSEFGPVTYTCTIDMSESAVALGALSSTFETNHGARRARVFDGTFSVPLIPAGADPASFPITVNLDTPFWYDPGAGVPLILDIRMLAVSGAGGFADGESSAGIAQVYHDADANAAVANGSSGSGLAVRLGGDGGNCIAESYGAGCPGVSGTPECFTAGLPRLPNPDFRLELRNGPPGSAAFVALGLTEAALPLDGFGMPGCVLHNNQEFGVQLVLLDGAGAGWFPQPMPNIPSLAGMRFKQQWACLDSTANSLGVSMSNAMRLKACRF